MSEPEKKAEEEHEMTKVRATKVESVAAVQPQTVQPVGNQKGKPGQGMLHFKNKFTAKKLLPASGQFGPTF